MTFSEDDTAKIIQNLEPNKVHGHDHISICMLKTCGETVCKALECIFQECFWLISTRMEERQFSSCLQER